MVVDNYDSFTYNLCQYLGDLGADFVVYKNDEKTIEEIRVMNPAGVLVSPGPGGLFDLWWGVLCIEGGMYVVLQLVHIIISCTPYHSLHTISLLAHTISLVAHTISLFAHTISLLAGRPEDSGISLDVIAQLGPHFPVFGVCMGHQCIGQSFGGRVIRAPCGVMHGKTSDVFHTNTGLLEVCVCGWVGVGVVDMWVGVVALLLLVVVVQGSGGGGILMLYYP